MKRWVFAVVVWAFALLSVPSLSRAADVIDLGIEKIDLYSGGGITTNFTTLNGIALVATVRNYSSIAIDGFTLVPKIDTYKDGVLLNPSNGAFYFQPNYINSAASKPLSIDKNGTFVFHADISQPKAGHYRCVVSFTVGGSIGNMDSNSANNQKTVEFDVRQVEAPKPDLAVENLQISPVSDTFQVSYTVRNIGTDPAESVFDMKTKLYVIKDPTTIMTREDVFKPHNQPLAPGASVAMGPFVIRDSRTPSAGLAGGSYRIGVYTTQGCSNDTNVPNNYSDTVYSFTGSGQTAPSVIDLGIEKTDLYSTGVVNNDFTTLNPISLVTTVRNYSSIALDGFTLVPKIDTYRDGVLLNPSNGAFYFQPNYINNAASTPLSIDKNGTFVFRADMTQPKAGHYRCIISFSLGGSIGNQDSNSANNQKTIEFDVRQVEAPKPDLAVENLKFTKTADTFQVTYTVRNIGTDPAQSVFDMKTKLYVIKSPTTIMTREDVFKPHNQPLAPGASVSMGPFVIRDSRNPSAGLGDGIYKTGVYTTQGCSNDTNVPNNYLEVLYNFWQGGGDYTIDGAPSTQTASGMMTVSYRCAVAQPDLNMGLFGANESGTNPKLGWKAATDTSGTLSFKAPGQAGRYLFKLYRQNGAVLASSPVFTVMGAAASIAGTMSENTLNPAVDSARLNLGKKVLPGKAGFPGIESDSQETDCARNLPLNSMNGYSVSQCTADTGETMIYVDENTASARNIRSTGERKRATYVWAGEAGACPGDAQVKRFYMAAAKKAGAKTLVDRPRYSAFEFTGPNGKTYASVETLNNGRTVMFISVTPGTETEVLKTAPIKRLSGSVIKKRSLASGDAEGTGELSAPPDTHCLKNLPFTGIDGYTVAGCVTSQDGVVILIDQNPDSERNVTRDGKTVSVRYTWPEEGGPAPGDVRIRRIYKDEAKTLGGKVLADRPGYAAFALTLEGRKTWVAVETSDHGKTITCTAVAAE